MHEMLCSLCSLEVLFFPLQAHIMHPQLLELCMRFYSATAIWLAEQIKQENEQIFPIPEQVNKWINTLISCYLAKLI